MSAVPYVRGLREVAPGCSVWFEPPGSWGLSNSGVVKIGDEVLVVDTQNDVARGRALRAAALGVADTGAITTVVNTHEDGDHWFGNMFFDDCRIVSTTAAADGMRALRMDPRRLPEFGSDGSTLREWSRWRAETFSYEDWRPVFPAETFDDALTIKLGGGAVELIEVGPAHTGGDAIVHVPDTGVVFTGDILFHRSTPIVWTGPVSNTIAACDTVLALEPAVIVPGHGPAAGPAGVREVRSYLSRVLEHTIRCIERGAEPEEAYRSFDAGEYRLWAHASRAFLTILSVYAEHDPDRPRPSWAESMEIVLSEDAG